MEVNELGKTFTLSLAKWGLSISSFISLHEAMRMNISKIRRASTRTLHDAIKATARSILTPDQSSSMLLILNAQ